MKGLFDMKYWSYWFFAMMLVATIAMRIACIINTWGAVGTIAFLGSILVYMWYRDNHPTPD
jgi:hypothetical protein